MNGKKKNICLYKYNKANTVDKHLKELNIMEQN